MSKAAIAESYFNSTTKPGKKRPFPASQNENWEQIMAEEIARGRKLYIDVLCFWPSLMVANYYTNSPLDEKQRFLNDLCPVPRYLQGYLSKGFAEVLNFLKKNKRNEAFAHALFVKKQTEALADFSDTAKIQAYDNLVDLFNEALPEIKRNNDLKLLIKFLKKAESLVKKKYSIPSSSDKSR